MSSIVRRGLKFFVDDSEVGGAAITVSYELAFDMTLVGIDKKDVLEPCGVCAFPG